MLFEDLYTQKRDGCSFISAFILIAIILVCKRVKEKNCGLGVLACVIFLPLIDINVWYGLGCGGWSNSSRQYFPFLRVSSLLLVQ